MNTCPCRTITTGTGPIDPLRVAMWNGAASSAVRSSLQLALVAAVAVSEAPAVPVSEKSADESPKMEKWAWSAGVTDTLSLPVSEAAAPPSQDIDFPMS